MHGAQDVLEAACAGAVRKRHGDGFIWDHVEGANVSPLWACSLALWGSRQHVDVPVESDFLVL